MAFNGDPLADVKRKLLWWLIGGLTTVITIGGGAWITSIYGQVTAIQQKQEAQQTQLNNAAVLAAANSERILSTEDNIKIIREDVKEIRRLLEVGIRPRQERP